MAADPQETIAAISRGLPQGLTVREHRPADLAAEVDFQNRYGRPAERRALADIERWESLADPREVRLRLVLESGGGLAGVAGTGDGGKWRPPDGSWNIGMRLDDHWKRKGIGTVLADALERFARESGAPALTAGLRGDEPAGIAFAHRRSRRRRPSRTSGASSSRARPSSRERRRSRCVAMTSSVSRSQT